MRRMRGSDAFHLYKESRTQHLHTLKVQILDPTGAHWQGDFDDFKRAFERGVAVIPPFHWRLVKVPFGLAHPLWRYVRDLDIDYHVRRAHVPTPGGAREFDELISEIASQGLERDRPLWQLWVVEGLEGGRVAYVTKLHHALADGTSSAQILFDAFDAQPVPFAERPALEESEPEPARISLLADALRYQLQLNAAFPRLLGRTLRAWGIGLWRLASRKPRMAAPFSAPATCFNRPVSPHRWFANADVALSDMRRVKEVFGGTLNDVFVAICSGALRDYLKQRGELPTEPLTASIPVSIREDHERRSYGNRLGTWLVGLASEVEDPVTRYEMIRRNTAAARESFEAKDRQLLADWQEHWWWYRTSVEGVQKLATRLLGRPPFHVIMSNVKGPPQTIYSNGARVVGLRSMGPILDGSALNFTGWSYVDTMSIGVVACREHLPDLRRLVDGISGALAELLEAANERADSASPQRVALR